MPSSPASARTRPQSRKRLNKSFPGSRWTAARLAVFLPKGEFADPRVLSVLQVVECSHWWYFAQTDVRNECDVGFIPEGRGQHLDSNCQ